MQGLDVIGDVHGHHEALVGLLTHMGYQAQGGVWCHPSRQAIFVGDLIDRGPSQVAVVDFVRSMVAAGSAQCILGNHEFNAIGWATKDLDRPGEFLRSRTKDGNRRQHEAFLAEVEGTPKHNEIVAWFKTLPLWLDLGGIRIVHACWDEESMEILRPVLGPNHTLTEEAIRRGSRMDDPVFAAIEKLCKGPEMALPGGLSWRDSEGKTRHEVRVRWWKSEALTFRDLAEVNEAVRSRIPDAPLDPRHRPHPYSGPPVLFGHYWFPGDRTPDVISTQFACLDHSVARNGPLVAYRWDGEQELSRSKMVWWRNGEYSTNGAQ